MRWLRENTLRSDPLWFYLPETLLNEEKKKKDCFVISLPAISIPRSLPSLTLPYKGRVLKGEGEKINCSLGR